MRKVTLGILPGMEEMSVQEVQVKWINEQKQLIHEARAAGHPQKDITAALWEVKLYDFAELEKLRKRLGVKYREPGQR